MTASMIRVLLFVMLARGRARASGEGLRSGDAGHALHPSPDDWLMYSRTYDAQRFSPLKQVNRSNVGQLRMAWTRGLGPGTSETIPIVHNGVMYLVEPGAIVEALDATNGDLIWEYKRKVPSAAASTARTKALAIYQDVILYTAPDGYVVGLDARTGEQRWQTSTGEARTRRGLSSSKAR